MQASRAQFFGMLGKQDAICRNRQIADARICGERAGLSQEQAAAKAGTTRTTVYLAERGLLSETIAKKLAPVLGVKVSELLGAR